MRDDDDNVKVGRRGRGRQGYHGYARKTDIKMCATCIQKKECNVCIYQDAPDQEGTETQNEMHVNGKGGAERS